MKYLIMAPPCVRSYCCVFSLGVISRCSLQEVATMFPDRVISVRGPIDNMSEAEAAISVILRECYEKEMQQPPVVGVHDWLAACLSVCHPHGDNWRGM